MMCILFRFGKRMQIYFQFNKNIKFIKNRNIFEKRINLHQNINKFLFLFLMTTKYLVRNLGLVPINCKFTPGSNNYDRFLNLIAIIDSCFINIG